MSGHVYVVVRDWSSGDVREESEIVCAHASETDANNYAQGANDWLKSKVGKPRAPRNTNEVARKEFELALARWEQGTSPWDPTMRRRDATKDYSYVVVKAKFFAEGQ